MESNECSISKEVIFEIQDKAFAEGSFVCNLRLKVMMRVSEEMHGLLIILARLLRKPLKRWEKPVNLNHEKLFM